MRVYAFVPAKGTSERVHNKNIRFLDGERLFIRALKKLLQCNEIDEIFLDTESDEMYKMADYLPIRFLKRDINLADKNTDGHKMLLNEINTVPDADIYVQLLCTSPFIEPETIDNAIRILKNSDDYDSAVLMKKDKFYFWENGQPVYDKKHIPNSKDLPETLIESMGLYVIKKDAALKYQRRYGEKPLFVYGKLRELIDVNTDEDFEFAENFSQGLKRKENKKLALIKHFVTSAALSDIIDDINIEQNTICGMVTNGFKPNIKNSKLFGRAATLRLRKLREGEKFQGIYKALESYDSICENDIIIVENELSEYAYFGDLNARLAIRAGASGAIINGATRDKKMTEILGFPVFAKSYNSQDVRRRATLDYYDKPVNISGVTVNPNDLIFIDEGAMVVIYREYEQEIIKRVLNTFLTEQNIVENILSNKDVFKIVNSNGYF